jgi:hypothetical protein
VPADSPAWLAVLERCGCFLLLDGLPARPADLQVVLDARLRYCLLEDWPLHAHHAPRASPRLAVQT